MESIKSDVDTSYWVTVSLQHALELKAHGSHLSCKTTTKYLHVCEHVEVVGRNKDVHPIHSLPVHH